MQLKKYWLILPVLLALACHFPALLCDFTWDDATLVKTNTALDSTPLLEFYSQDYGLHLGHRNPVGYYRPTFVALLSLLYRVAGPSALVFHSLSLLMFCGTVVLVTLVTRKALGTHDKYAAMLAGCLYAVHAARTEVAALIMSLPDLAVEACTMALLLLIMNHPKTPTARNGIITAAAGFFISFTALTMKESAFFVIAGIMGCLLIRMIATQNNSPRRWIICIASVAAGFTALYLNHTAGIERQPVTAYVRAVLTEGSGGALHAAAIAIRDLLIPGQPVFMHELTIKSSLASILVVIILLGLLAGAGFYLCRKAKPGALLFGWFAAGIVSLMFIGAVGVPYSQRYVPVAPAVIGAVLVLSRFPHLLTKQAFRFSVALYIALHAAFTLGGTIKCRDNLTFFTFMADENPNLVYPRLYLTDRLFNEYRNYELMELHARRGIDIAPESAESITLRKFLTRKLLIDGQPGNAATVLDDATGVLEQLQLPDDAELLWLKGICHLELGERDEALPLLQKAVELEPMKLEYSATLNSVTNRPNR